tara:strand:- start:2201 stop:2416 length:216 start_codon:yes stop_codon:yes gene_type:complete
VTSTNPKSIKLINKEDVNEMIENAIRRHHRRVTIISAILGWIIIEGIHFVCFMWLKTYNLLSFKKNTIIDE